MVKETTSAHTPEPWKVQQGTGSWHFRGPALEIVANGELPDRGEILAVLLTNVEANGHLMAAAPTMLAALEVAEDAHALRNFEQTGWIAAVVEVVLKYPVILDQNMTADEAATTLFNHAVDLRAAAIAQARGAS